MPTTIVKQIYFGKYADLDPVEASATTGNYNNDWSELQEVAGWVVGTTFNLTTMRMIDIAQNDTVRQSNSNRLEENDFENAPSTGGGPGKIAADTITYNLGAGSVTSKIDSTFVWSLKVTLEDGRVLVREAAFIQLEDGAIFSNFDNADFLNLKIKSIALFSYVSGNYYGATGKRSLTSVQLLCFSAETMILTPSGAVPVGDLRVGDQIITRDYGAQPIRWVARRKVMRDQIVEQPNLGPIRIAPNAFGAQMPTTPLVLSPQHRVLVRSAVVRRMTGDQEALVSIKHLQGYPGIAPVETPADVTYVHIALSQHDIVYANGLPAETLFPGKMVLESLSSEDQMGLRRLFAETEPSRARHFLTRREAQTLMRRHLKNRLALIQDESDRDSPDSVRKPLPRHVIHGSVGPGDPRVYLS